MKDHPPPNPSIMDFNFFTWELSPHELWRSRLCALGAFEFGLPCDRIGESLAARKAIWCATPGHVWVKGTLPCERRLHKKGPGFGRGWFFFLTLVSKKGITLLVSRKVCIHSSPEVSWKCIYIIQDFFSPLKFENCVFNIFIYTYHISYVKAPLKFYPNPKRSKRFVSGSEGGHHWCPGGFVERVEKEFIVGKTKGVFLGWWKNSGFASVHAPSQWFVLVVLVVLVLVLVVVWVDEAFIRIDNSIKIQTPPETATKLFGFQSHPKKKIGFDQGNLDLFKVSFCFGTMVNHHENPPFWIIFFTFSKHLHSKSKVITPPFHFTERTLHSYSDLTELGMIFCLLIPNEELSTESKEFGDSTKKQKSTRIRNCFWGANFLDIWHTHSSDVHMYR